MKEIFTHDDTVKALQSWLSFGEQAYGTCQQGYFSGNGWAARVLRSHVEALLSPQKSEPPSASVPEERSKDSYAFALHADGTTTDMDAYQEDQLRDAERYRHLRACADREFVDFHDGTGHYNAGGADALDTAVDNSRTTMNIGGDSK